MSASNLAPRQIGRRELFDRIWSKPMTVNAAELGTTTWTLSALARRLGLPLPRPGHWMKKEVGKAPPTPEFPADPMLDESLHSIPVPQIRRTPSVSAKPDPETAIAQTRTPEPISGDSLPAGQTAPAPAEIAPAEHKKVESIPAVIEEAGTTNNRQKSVTLTREELHQKVWETPMSRLAVEFGLSDNGLAKICRRFDIPIRRADIGRSWRRASG